MSEANRAAILVESQYESLELWYPCLRLKEMGLEVDLVGPSEAGKTYLSKEGYPATTNTSIEEALGRSYRCIVVPGGVAPDKLRRYPQVLELVRKVHDGGGLVASICHGPSVLISARILKGRRLTCVCAIKDDVVNAGAEYIDAEVVVDRNLITSRTPKDIPAWSREIVKSLTPRPWKEGPPPRSDEPILLA